MKHDVAHRLPVEIWDQIIDAIELTSSTKSRVADLKACSLICKESVNRARRYLFRVMTFSNSQEDGNDGILAKSSGLALSPHLTCYIREIHIIDDALELFMIEDPVFPQLLDNLPRELTVVELRIRSKPICVFELLPQAMSDSLTRILLLPSVVEMSIEGVMDVPYEVARRCALIPTVSRLACVNFIELEPPMRDVPPEIPPSGGIKSLTFRHAQIGHLAPFLRAMSGAGLVKLIVGKPTEFNPMNEFSIGNHTITFPVWDELLNEITDFQHSPVTLMMDLQLAAFTMEFNAHSLTWLECQRSTSRMSPQDVLKLELRFQPALRTIKLVVDFGEKLREAPDPLGNIREILETTADENSLKNILLEIRRAPLSESAYDRDGWRLLDELLDLPKFDGLEMVGLKLCDIQLEVGEHDEEHERLETVPDDEYDNMKADELEKLLPLLHDRGLVEILQDLE